MSDGANGRKFSKAEVAIENGRAVFMVDGQRLPPMAFTSNERLTRDYAEQLADAGINLYFIWEVFGMLNSDNEDEMQRQWQKTVDEARMVLDINPNAYIVLRVSLNPPEKWLDENPDDLVAFEDGRTDHCTSTLLPYKDTSRMNSLISRKFREDSADYLRKRIEAVEASDFGHRVIGYFLNGGCCGEWCYTNGIDSDENVYGFSPAFKWFYSQWLKEKYGTEENLRRVWKDEQASFAEPRIPGRKDQLLTRYAYPPKGVARASCQADWGHFLCPQTHQYVADFYEAWNAGTADTISYLGRVIKEKTDSRVVVGAFFGYMGTCHYQTSSGADPLVLADSPWVDFLSSPHNYEDRIPGGGATFRTPVDSLALRGKMWVNESDSRTHKTIYGEKVAYGGAYTLQQSLDILKRDFAQVICDDVYAYWFDIQPTWFDPNTRYSNFDDPDIIALLKRQQELAREYYEAGRGKVSDVAVVYDRKSMWYLDSEALRDLLWLNRDITLPHIGLPCDHVFHDDFSLGNVPDYKMYLFINCFYLSNEHRKAIDRVVKQAGKTAVWVYAPGLINLDAQNKMCVENMQKLTGFAFGAENAEREPTFKICDDTHELCRDLSVHRLYGRFERPIRNTFDWKRGDVQIQDPSLCSPLLYVEQDDETVVLGRFVTNDKVAYAVKEFENWRSVYIGAKVMNPAVLRAIAQAAGAHVYLDTDDIIYANSRFLTVHSVIEDEKKIRLPGMRREVTDAYTDDVVGRDCDSFKISMRSGETRMFRVV